MIALNIKYYFNKWSSAMLNEYLIILEDIEDNVYSAASQNHITSE